MTEEQQLALALQMSMAGEEMAAAAERVEEEEGGEAGERMDTTPNQQVCIPLGDSNA